MTNKEKIYDWIIYDIFRKVKIEIKAKTFDDAIRAARNAYPNFNFDCGHLADKNPRFNEQDFTLLQIKKETENV